MNDKAKTLLFTIFVSVFFLSACSSIKENRETLYQTSTINALLEGVYDGEMTFEELKGKGDFGIGTFNALDGEMIALNGLFYQIKSNGLAYEVKVSEKTPFALVTFFDSDISLKVNAPLEIDEIEKLLDSLLPSKNLLYAVKIEGAFTYIKTRSVPKQEKPYPRLAEVVKHQSLFEFHDSTGTIVGFRLPDFIKGINVPRYHFHFITEERDRGGHVLTMTLKDVNIEIDKTNSMHIRLPDNEEFGSAGISKDNSYELEKIEK